MYVNNQSFLLKRQVQYIVQKSYDNFTYNFWHNKIFSISVFDQIVLNISILFIQIDQHRIKTNKELSYVVSRRGGIVWDKNTRLTRHLYLHKLSRHHWAQNPTSRKLYLSCRHHFSRTSSGQGLHSRRHLFIVALFSPRNKYVHVVFMYVQPKAKRRGGQNTE